jgi:general secretion pathway protein K
MNRRGVAMLAALWLVVAIAIVALAFATTGKERRALGIQASDRSTGRAAAAGALAMMQARLDQALRYAQQGSVAIAATRLGDPWMDIDSVYSGSIIVDSLPVDVHAVDVGALLNINAASEDQLRTFFGFILSDFPKADQLAQTMMDWRDADDIPRSNGDEADGYIKKGLLTLPTNTAFRDVADIQQVEGMTPEIFAKVAPYMTTQGNGGINVNTAPIPVLRSLPGMTDIVVSNIVNLRSRGRRITSVDQVIPGGGSTGGRGGGAAAAAQSAQLTRYLYVDTRQVELFITAHPSRSAQPVRLTALLLRTGQTSAITWQQW